MRNNNGNDNDLHVVYAKQMQTHKRETFFFISMVNTWNYTM